MRYPLLVSGVVVLMVGCGGSGEDQSHSSNSGQVANAGAEAPTASSGRDPCTLVSQSDMETVMGPLGEPPYRVADRQPDPRGDTCMYRAKDQHNVTVHVDWDEGDMYFRAFGGVTATVDSALGVKQSGPVAQNGPWDAAITPYGQFIVLKGKTAVHVDPLGSRVGRDGAAKIASIALGRLGAPLAYDGAAPARKHPKPIAKDPCSLVTQAEVEALMGPLRSAPTASEDTTSCSFPLGSGPIGSQFDRILEVHWVDGFYALGQERQSTGMATQMLKPEAGPGMPALSNDAADQQEPWEERTTLIGGVITVVRRDVMLKVVADGFDGFNEKKALELLRLAAKRL